MKKIAIITGASSELGKSIALKFYNNNYYLILLYNNSYDSICDLTNKINNECKSYKCDFNNIKELNNTLESIKSEYKEIDVLVNCAAYCNDCSFEEKSIQEFQKILNINLIAPFYISKEIGLTMFENKSGKIINIASTNGIDTNYVESLDYDASKAGLINLAKNLAKQFAPYINVNCVAPGWINNSTTKNMEKVFFEEEKNKILLKRFAEPEEIANVVYFLATEDAKYINGQTIRVDGGINN